MHILKAYKESDDAKVLEYFESYRTMPTKIDAEFYVQETSAMEAKKVGHKGTLIGVRAERNHVWVTSVYEISERKLAYLLGEELFIGCASS